MRFDFCGGSYQSESPLADSQLTDNWYPEQMENPGSRVATALYPTPGLLLFCTLPGPSVRGSFTINGRTFKVSGTHLCELRDDGSFTDYGGSGTANNNILDDGLPATLVAGGTASGAYPGQLLISSGGALTAFNLVSNSYIAITDAPTNVLMIEYLDGFFVALVAGNDFQVSAVEDCTTWPGLSISQVSVFSDVLQAIIATNRLLWVFGGKRAVAYYNTGGAQFPFGVVNGGFMEVGILAQYSTARIALSSGTTVLWLGGDERGAGVVFAANGFTPQRVSDHPLEYWLQQQTLISDAVGWATQEYGHNFYHLWFPTANAQWVLDVDLGLWHKRSSLVDKQPAANLSRCHTYNFGKHLVGDRNSGNVYVMTTSTFTDNSQPIIRTRIGPTISRETQFISIGEFQVDFEVGLGPIPPLLDVNKKPRGPLAMFSYSHDFGKTWSAERMINCGQAGEFRVRAVDRRLGTMRAWTPKVTVSDPIAWRIADAYVNPTEDSTPRASKQYARSR